LRVEGSADHRAEQLTGFGVGQAVYRDRRKLLEHPLCGRFADAGDEADAVRAQAAGDETEHLRRFGIEPVRVIDNAQQRLCFSRLGKQRKRRQSHQEPLRWRPCLLSERGFWVSVLDALRQTAACSSLVRPLTAAPDLDGWAIVERLLTDLEPLEDQTWLVIDDAHELRSAEALRQLELLVLLQRRREGLQLTKAGAVLLDVSRTVLSLVDHEVNRTRQAAGL
jgi:hypothetical protein